MGLRNRFDCTDIRICNADLNANWLFGRRWVQFFGWIRVSNKYERKLAICIRNAAPEEAHDDMRARAAGKVLFI